jgi:hypothetical protein
VSCGRELDHQAAYLHTADSSTDLKICYSFQQDLKHADKETFNQVLHLARGRCSYIDEEGLCTNDFLHRDLNSLWQTFENFTLQTGEFQPAVVNSAVVVSVVD